ncbi:MAG: DMT family transporter [Proteobacteria bacterium]|nr:DMT family transporter [Pseudomonadota bacterium]
MSAPRSDSRLTLAEIGAIVLIVVIWGVNNAAAKMATQVLPPMLVGALRFVLASAILLPFVRPPFPQWKNLALLAICAGPVHFGLIYFGFSIAHDLSPLSVSLQLWIPMTVLFSWLLLGEPMSRAAMAGLALAFAGVAIMTGDAHALRDWPAIAVGVVASAAWALGAIIARRTAAVPALKLQGIISLFAAPCMGLASAVFERQRWGALAHADAMIWGSVVFAAVASTVGATVMLFWLVQRREAGRVTPYMLTSPLVSGAIGVGLMGDVLTPQIVAGAAICIGGVAVVAITERLRAKSGRLTPTETAEKVGSMS